jgi:hypothetical protein
VKDNQCVHFEHTIPIFGIKLHVLTANNYTDAWARLFTGIPKEINPNAFGSAWFEESTRTAYVGLKTSATAQTIAHEALHITHAILKNIGHVADFDNDEVECYLLGYLMVQLMPGKEDTLIPYPKK